MHQKYYRTFQTLLFVLNAQSVFFHAVELNSLHLFIAEIFGYFYYYYYDIIKPCLSVMMFVVASAALFMFTSGFQCSIQP